MPPRLPSASGVWRALMCPASCVLPEVGLIVGDAARFGTEVHSFLERVPQIGRDAALDMVPAQDRGFCENIPLDRLPVAPGKFMQEVSLALDLESGSAKKLGESLGRNYPIIFTRQVHGTADVLAQAGKRKGYLADYKTGSESHVPDPAENPQLLTLACAAARTYGWDSVVLELHFIREGFVWTKTAEVDVLTLDAHLATLRKLWERIETMDPANPAMCEGDWCTWCSSFKVCPAKTRLASAMVVGEDPKLTLRLDESTLPVIWERLEQAEAIIRAVKGACESFAQAVPGGVPLPDGRVFGPHEGKQERVTDGAKAWEYLMQRYGSDVAEAGTTRHASKDSIREALRAPMKEAQARGEKTSLAALERSAMADLREFGAVKEVVTVKIEPYWPKNN